MILLDTCTLIWLASEQSELSQTAKKLIGDNAGQLHVSSISAFEIALMSKKGKLVSVENINIREWFAEALGFHGINEISINHEITVASVELPEIHKDPCDRIIVATAQIQKMTVLTPDKLIKQYDVDVVW